MKQERKVIHIELLDPPPGCKKHHYFGSIAAIYDTFSKEEIGATKETLWNVLNSGEYQTRKAIIREGVIIPKKTDRGKKKEQL